MRLATAIRMGSLLIQEPVAGKLEFCALGMAGRAVGRTLNAADLLVDAEWLRTKWPWITGLFHECPSCGAGISDLAVVYHPFDSHVMTGIMTIEALCDWLDSIDPTPPTVDSQESVETSQEANSEKVSA